jgi:L-aminopeptidase/D-esterase-like protein
VPALAPSLPDGVLVGHWTDREAWTGCTAILLPDGSVSSCEVRGGGAGTIGTEILSPASASVGAHAILLTGGSAFGLAAADGVSGWLEERGIGYHVASSVVPLVPGAVVFDLELGQGSVRPTAESGYAACEAAVAEAERGSVGAGTGCTVGKLLGGEHWTKGGLGVAAEVVDGAVVAAIAVVNPIGEVLAEDASVLAGVWKDGAYRRTADLMRADSSLGRRREATTLVCIATDARLSKTQAWLVARAAQAGMARAVAPIWTPSDGDTIFCVATNRVDAAPLVVTVVAAEVTAAAIRDGVRQATGAPGCPAAADRRA